ncbi:MFS transporter [Collimonas pratensis]|uniref:Putative tartrate transporter n=1 Tax=Collimonas pratensis TaxID=279113 RepID=A0A127Q401_9BURK|nr:MFS transporter [Collimonas pratensis]AMP04372.1 major Facilitator Superfamily protein [Collimonas pratensis]AMP15635.1 major Facilitator Superfamily protein [Collimonas pratensis]NKI69971.1 MFS transporter [Collimonas pratensis]
MSEPSSPANAAAGSAFEAATYAKVTWRLLPMLFLCYVASYLDRVNVGFAKLQMLNDLKFSETVYGLGAGIFFIGYFIFEIPSNMMLHRVGARLWIARIMISWGLISGAMIFVDSPTSFYAMRFLLGVAEAGFFPGVILYLTYWYPAHRRGKMTALFMTGVPVSGVIGGPLSGWIMKALPGVHGLAGWQWMFILEAIPSLVLGVVVIFYLQDRIRGAAWLSEQEKLLLEAQIQAETSQKQEASLGQMFANPRVWLMALIYFCFVMGLYGVSFWLPTIIKTTGVTDTFNIGLLTAIPYATAAVAMILIGHSADLRRERRWHVAIPAVLGCIGLIFSTVYDHNTLLAMAALTLATVGIITVLPLFWSLPTAFLGGAAAAAGIALINSLGNLAGFVSPYLVGWLKDQTHSTNSGMYVLAASLLLGAVLTLSVPKHLVNK